jgi:hypothetical protein
VRLGEVRVSFGEVRVSFGEVRLRNEQMHTLLSFNSVIFKASVFVQRNKT